MPPIFQIRVSHGNPGGSFWYVVPFPGRTIWAACDASLDNAIEAVLMYCREHDVVDFSLDVCGK